MTGKFVQRKLLCVVRLEKNNAMYWYIHGFFSNQTGCTARRLDWLLCDQIKRHEYCFAVKNVLSCSGINICQWRHQLCWLRNVCPILLSYQYWLSKWVYFISIILIFMTMWFSNCCGMWGYGVCLIFVIHEIYDTWELLREMFFYLLLKSLVVFVVWVVGRSQY